MFIAKHHTRHSGVGSDEHNESDANDEERVGGILSRRPLLVRAPPAVGCCGVATKCAVGDAGAKIESWLLAAAQTEGSKTNNTTIYYKASEHDNHAHQTTDYLKNAMRLHLTIRTHTKIMLSLSQS